MKIPFGIIVPMEAESSWFQENIQQRKKMTIAGIHYELGMIADKPIVLVKSGVGKTNAAAITACLIKDFQPDLILLSGSAGSINPTLKKGEVLVGKTVVDVDFGQLTKNGMQFLYHQYLTHALQFDLAEELVKKIAHLSQANLPRINLGKIATSDAQPNQAMQIELLQEAKFYIVEMEGAAVMQTGWLFKTLCIIVRGISNHVEEPFTENDLQLAGDNAAKVVISFIASYNIR